ncbi:IS200/IS605 family transposase [Escherichia coli]|uniref:IS200/IS605 family transposase n=1 Tax=Escherichia coli TaxID=562 RepID=UPI0023F7D142|nr:IS200/IS605 family transposase [Escherichia coli]MDF7688100.1 IS200/IS605 family transposase [Escherichia coli]
MKKETDIRRGRHCVFLKHVHLVFVTKYRRQIFDHDATEKLRTYFSNVCADFEAERVEMDGGPDHVHLLINYPPKLAISSLVNSLKGVSSRLLRRDRPDIAVRYYDKGVLWSPGYFVSSCILTYQLDLITTISVPNRISKEGANKQVISSQADSLIKISRIWADFFPANTSNQPI